MLKLTEHSLVPRTRIPKRLQVVAGIGVLILGLAACSSSSGSGSGGGGSAAGSSAASSGSGSSAAPSGSTANPTGVLTSDEAGAVILKQLGALPVLTGDTVRGIVGKVVTVGSVATDTKAGQHTQPGICDGAKARFARANKEGGVNGYTFNYVGCSDDTAAPGPAQQEVQDLVESKKVFAIAIFNSATGNLGSYFLDNKVPYFGYLGVDYCGWADKAYGASITGESACANPLPGKTIVNTAAITAFLKASGKKASDIKFALYANSDPYGKAGLAGMKAAAEAVGIKVVYAVADLPSATEPPLTDFTPVASKLIATGANLVWSGTTAPATLGVTAALKSNGYTGTLFWGQATSSLLNDPGTAATVDGMWATTTTGSLAFGDAPLSQLAADFKAINSTYPIDGFGAIGAYEAADLMIQAMAKVSGPLTAEKLMNVINQGGFTYTGIPSVTCTQSWPAGRVLAPACAGVVVYDAAAKKLDSKLPLQNIGGYLIQSS
jgi:branched-chain amino acid transport system substrate-binding protein